MQPKAPEGAEEARRCAMYKIVHTRGNVEALEALGP